MEKNARAAEAAVYVRESRDEQHTKYETIENQKRLLQDYAARQGWHVYQIYEDDNVSGTSFFRPGLDRLTRDMEAGCFDIILLKDLSRLGRHNGRTLLFLEAAEEAGIRIVAADGRYDSFGCTELAGLDSWFNERYAADISRKIRASLQYKIQSGEYVGTAPYGYRKVKGEGRLEPFPEQAFYVGKIYELYLAGWGYARIARHFTEKKIPPPKSRWSSQTVMRILRSPVYTGVTVQGVSQKISYKSKKTRRLPEDQWVITENTHKPIISREIFEKVRQLRQEKKPGEENNRGRISPYKNLVFCGYCGSKMYAKDDGYLCSAYIREGVRGCRRCYSKESEITKVFLPLLQSALAVISVEDGEERTAPDPLSTVETLCRKRLELLYEDRLRGLIDSETYLRLSEQEKERLYAVQSEKESAAISTRRLFQRFLHETAESISPELLRDMAMAVIEKCTVK